MVRIFGVIFALAVGIWASSIITDAAQKASETFRASHVSGLTR
jgi:hypothetical protein